MSMANDFVMNQLKVDGRLFTPIGKGGIGFSVGIELLGLGSSSS